MILWAKNQDLLKILVFSTLCCVFARYKVFYIVR